jgi:hypothetical protein
MPDISKSAFILAAKPMFSSNPRGRKSCEREFRSLFGVGPAVCADLWWRCKLPARTEPKHLLWALLFLGVYVSEDVLCSITKTSRKTFRKWSWLVVGLIAGEAKHVVSYNANFSIFKKICS